MVPVPSYAVVFRADAAFAKPEIYEALEERGVNYAIRIPANDSLERDIAELLTRPLGRPSYKPVVWYKGFLYQAASWKTARRVYTERVREAQNGNPAQDPVLAWSDPMHDLTRRGLMSGAAACLCALRAAGEDSDRCLCEAEALPEGSYRIEGGRLTIDLSQAPALRARRGSAACRPPGQKLNLLIVRTGARRWAALSGRCTHGGMALSFNPHKGLIQCRSFGHAMFDLDGAVLKGPAEKPLALYRTWLEAGKLVVALEGA